MCLPQLDRTPSKLDRRLQTRNLVAVFCLDIGNDMVFAGRNLFRQVDTLCKRHSALFKWTREIDLLNHVAKISSLFDDGNDSVFDSQMHNGARFNVLAECAAGRKVERHTAGRVRACNVKD